MIQVYPLTWKGKKNKIYQNGEEEKKFIKNLFWKEFSQVALLLLWGVSGLSLILNGNTSDNEGQVYPLTWKGKRIEFKENLNEGKLI